MQESRSHRYDTLHKCSKHVMLLTHNFVVSTRLFIYLFLLLVMTDLLFFLRHHLVATRGVAAGPSSSSSSWIVLPTKSHHHYSSTTTTNDVDDTAVVSRGLCSKKRNWIKVCPITLFYYTLSYNMYVCVCMCVYCCCL